jgi:cytosine permease
VNTLFPSVPITPIVILAVVVITLTALKGIRAMTWLSNIAVPLIFLFGVISITFSIRNWSGIDLSTRQISPDLRISLAFAISLAVGSFSHGATANTAEVLRFAKGPKHAVPIMLIAMLFGNTFMLVFGGVGMLSTGEYDMAMILKAQNLLAPAFLVVLLNIWSTAQGLVYASANAIAAKINVKRTYICIVIGVIALGMALLHFYDYFGTWIDMNAKFVPPFAGIIIADYFFVYKRKLPNVQIFNQRMPLINWAGFITWAFGSVLAGFGVLDFGLPTVNYIIVCIILKVTLSIVIKQDKKIIDEVNAEEEQHPDLRDDNQRWVEDSVQQ